MPIGNYYQTDYTLARVAAPVAAASGGTFVTLAAPATDVVYTDFKRTLTMDVEPTPLTLGWPLASVFNIGELSYRYEISMPILLRPSKNPLAVAVRSEELDFWATWVQYAASSLDKVTLGGRTVSVVVERASLRVAPNEVSLGLTIRSNLDLGWAITNDWRDGLTADVVMARTARHHDTFIKYQGHSDTATPLLDAPTLLPGTGLPIGWENTYGIQSFSMTISSRYETLCTTACSDNSLPRTHSAGTPISTLHLADALNVTLVTLEGDLEIFGPTQSATPVSLQDSETAVWGALSDNILTSAMAGGGIKVWVGRGDPYGVVQGRMVAVVPNDLIVSEATTSTGGQLVTETRKFHGVLSGVPTLPNAKTSHLQ